MKDFIGSLYNFEDIANSDNYIKYNEYLPESLLNFLMHLTLRTN